MMRRSLALFVVYCVALCSANVAPADPPKPDDSAALQIIKARYGAGENWRDVTEKLQKIVWDDSLTVHAGSESLGVPPRRPKNRVLQVTYRIGGEEKQIEVPDGQMLQIGPKVSMLQVRKGNIENLSLAFVEFAKTHPNDIFILQARFGADPKWKDVIETVQSAVDGDCLTLPVTTELLGDPVRDQEKTLQVTYGLGKDIKTIEQKQNTTLQIGPRVVHVMVSRGKLINVSGKLAELRKKYPAGLIVLSAQWGTERRQADITDLLQSAVVGDSLTVPVTYEALGDPARGEEKTLLLTYAVGNDIKSVEQKQGTTLQIGPKQTAVIAPKGGLLIIEPRIAELRKQHPGGLLILEAAFAAGSKNNDVTKLLQDAVNGDSLTVPVTTDILGDPVSGWNGKKLKVVYNDGRETKYVEQDEGKTLQIGPHATAFLIRDGKLINMEARAAELRRKYPTGLIIMDARFGDHGRDNDVTQLLQSVVSGDSITVPVEARTLGDPSPGSSKTLRVTYVEGDQVKSVSEKEGAMFQVGPRRTSYVPIKGGLLNVDQRVTELRKTHPAGLLILDANYGTFARWNDVTDQIQKLVDGDSVTVDVNSNVFGDPSPSQAGKKLIMTYFTDNRPVTVEVPEGSPLSISPDTVVTLTPGGLEMTQDQRLAFLRSVYGEGLIIVDAQYGAGNRWRDVRDIIQNQTCDDALSVTVGDHWGDPAQGSQKEVKITYWDGKEIQQVTKRDGEKVELSGEKPDVVTALKPLPRFVAQGRPMSHAFGWQGTFQLLRGPQGVQLTSNGTLKWTPTAEQVGLQQLRISMNSGDKTYTAVWPVEVVRQEVAAPAGGDPAKLAAMMRLDIDSVGCLYTLGTANRSAVVLSGRNIYVLNPDGITIQRQAKLERVYLRIAERAGYYVALCVDPCAIDLLDKKTFKPIKTIKLTYPNVTDMAVHPTKAVTYVAINDHAGNSARYRYLVVDETAGKAHEEDNLVGRWLIADPTGNRLYAAFSDLYRRGTHYFMNPDGGIWDSPMYGNVDLLLIYDITNSQQPKLVEVKDRIGTNGSGLRLSPDGKRITYLSHTGYPRDAGAIPAWNVFDISSLPVTYVCKNRAALGRMTYHPTLPLVVVPANPAPLIFDRESADESKDRVQVPPGVLDGVEVVDAYFSPDGTNAILMCRKGGSWWLYKLPLKLTVQEKARAMQGIPATSPTTPATPVQPEPATGERA